MSTPTHDFPDGDDPPRICRRCSLSSLNVRDPVVCDGPPSEGSPEGVTVDRSGEDRRQGPEDRRDGDYVCQNCGATDTARVIGGAPSDDGKHTVGTFVVICDSRRGGCGNMDRRNPEPRRRNTERRGQS